MRPRPIIVSLAAAGLALVVAVSAQAVTTAHSVSLGDAALPNDTTWSFYNSFTAAKTPTGNHLDLAKAAATYNPTTQTLMVDWVTYTPITSSNCPDFHNGARCQVSLDLWTVDPTTNAVDPLRATEYELTAVPFGPTSFQYIRACSYGDCWPFGPYQVLKTETFGHHQVVWFRLKNWPTVRLRPGTVATSGFTSGGAANLNDPYWIDSKHDMATFIDWTGDQNTPDLLIG